MHLKEEEEESSFLSFSAAVFTPSLFCDDTSKTLILNGFLY